METTVSYLLILQKYINLKQKNSEIKDYTLCLDNVSNDFTTNNMEEKAIGVVVKFLSIDFNPIDTNDISEIHKYLMERT